MPHSLRTSVAAGLLALTLPASTLAATPAQLVQQTLQTAAMKFPISYQFTMDLNVKDTTFATKKTTDGTVSLTLDQRILPKIGTAQDTEGTLTFRLSLGQSETLESLLMLGEAPSFSVDWKRSGTDLYFRIRNVPKAWIDGLKSRETYLQDLDLNAYIDHWIHVDGEAADGITKLMDQQTTLLKDKTNDTTATEITNLFKNTNLFLVTRTEKVTTNVAGEKIQRVNLRLNPALLANWRATALKKVNRKSSDAKYQIQSINTQYASGKKIMARLSFAANVNLTTQVLERLEYGYHGTEPRKTCVWNEKTYTSNCNKVIGSTAYHVTGALTLKKDAGQAVEAPSGPLSLQTLVDAFKKAEDANTKALQAQWDTTPVIQPIGDGPNTSWTETDTDGDGLTNVDESSKYGTNPNLKDTDGDGFPDGEEVHNGFNPFGTGLCPKPGCLL